jgi:hypothetical protein
VPYVLPCGLESNREQVIAESERIKQSFAARLRYVLE